ncbi:MAG: toxin-antitoxin system YwqK family antitoxin [Rhodoluna sp.]
MSTGSPLYDNGLPRFKGEYQDGLMHGYWEFYRKDGSLMRSGYFDRDQQVDAWKTFNRQGELVKETKFQTPR